MSGVLIIATSLPFLGPGLRFVRPLRRAAVLAALPARALFGRGPPATRPTE